MGLTKDAVISEFAANPALKSELISSLENDFTEHVRGKGIIIRKPDEEKEFLTNYEKNIIPTKVEQEIGSKIKAVHDQYDNDLFDLTGERKAANEKTYDFMKRKLNDLKTKAKKDDDPVLADKIKQLETELQTRKDWVSPDKVKEIESKYFNQTVSGRLTNSLDKKTIAVPAHITEEKAKQDYAGTQRSMLKQDFLNRYQAKQDNEGNIVYYLGEELQLNKQTAKPYSEDELISRDYAGYFAPPAKVQTGAGTGGNGQAKIIDINEATLKTKDEVMTYLLSKGLVVGSQQMTKEYSRILTDYGITQ